MLHRERCNTQSCGQAAGRPVRLNNCVDSGGGAMRCSQQTNRATRPQQNEARGKRGNKNATIARRGKGSAWVRGAQRGRDCNDNRQQLQSKKLNMQNETIEKGGSRGTVWGRRAGAGAVREGARIAGSQAVMQSGHNYLSGGRQGCQRWRQRLPQHCNFDVLATGWPRHTTHIDTPAHTHTQWHTGWPDDSSVERAVRGQ